MLELPILSISILLPLLSSLYIAFFISHTSSVSRQVYAIYVAILSSTLTLISTIYVITTFDGNNPAYQFVESYSWMARIGLDFHIGVDGISVYFVFLTALLTLICVIASLFTIKVQIKEYLLCFLLMESFCIGAFTAQNLLLFYLFFEIILIPMYLIIGIWGGENRVHAAVKFFLYTFFGSVFFLIALFYIYSKTQTFSMVELANILPTLPLAVQQMLWLAFFITFAVKVPMLPFHTWLPDAHVQAPTAGSVMLAGILLKFGAYGFLRISLPMLPDASKYFAIYVIMLSAAAVIYASLVALAQKDMKKMIAYSSIAHMGYVTAGIFTFTEAGLVGAVFQMLSHGVVSAALFLIVGALYERGHTKEIAEYGGVASKMPVLAVLFMISMLGSVALPGTSGFIGEFFTMVGVFEVNSWCAVLIGSGVVLGATYMLKLYRQVMLGQVTNSAVLSFNDLYTHEVLALAPLVILTLYLGLTPNAVLKVISLAVQGLVQ